MKNIHINNDDNYATPPELYNELNKEFNTTLRDFELGRRGVKEVKAQRSMVNGIYLPKRLKKRFTLKQI